MDKDVVIKVENLSKKFCRSLKRSMFYGSVDVAKNMLGIKVNTGGLRKNEFWALQDINFEVKKGETFGLIGANGSGKTTLLRMINGIFPPDRGKLMIKGRIGALIAVGAGFHPHMTGRENIYLNGSILGMTQSEIKRDMDSIIDFAEIGDFLDAPVSTYSSGMYVRLGFAIAIHSRPDIVLVDEILAVGDSKFQRKCLDKIKEMRKTGTTFFLVSHNMQNIEAMCQKVLFLHKGKQIMLDSPQETIPQYELMLQTGKMIGASEEKATRERGELKLVHEYSGFGTQEVKVKKIILKNKNNNPIKLFDSNEEMAMSIYLKAPELVENARFSISLVYMNDHQSDEENINCVGINKKVNIPPGESVITWKFDKLRLITGEYKITLALFDETFTNPYFQGHFGYFYIKKDIPNMLRVGHGTPFYWLDPAIFVERKK